MFVKREWQHGVEKARGFRNCRLLVAALPCFVLGEPDENRKPVPMRDVEIRGSAASETRRVDVVLVARIATPLGRIPINGQLRLAYDCQSVFRGTVSYNPFVRFFARLKGVDLITRLEGNVTVVDGSPCPTMAVRLIRGRAQVDTARLSGWLMMDSDSIGFIGPAWMMGDTSYHAALLGTQGGRRLEMVVHMFER